MSTEYNSIHTGTKVDNFDGRITALESSRVKNTGDNMTGILYMKGEEVRCISDNLTVNITPEANAYGNSRLSLWDTTPVNMGQVFLGSFTSGYQGLLVEGRRTIDGTTYANTLRLLLNASGQPVVQFSNQAAWLTALGLATTSTNTIPSIIAANTTNATITGAEFVQSGKVVSVRVLWTNKSAISVPASGNISNIEVGTLVSGKRPAKTVYAHSNGDNAGAAWYNVNTSGVIALSACEGTGAARTIAAGTTFNLYTTFILP